MGSDGVKILLEEGECYDHSYREHVSDHVDVVHLEPAGIRVEIPMEVETEHHVTTERLKKQPRSVQQDHAATTVLVLYCAACGSTLAAADFHPHYPRFGGHLTEPAKPRETER